MQNAKMFRNLSWPLLRTREHFEYWMFDMSDALEYFVASLPEEVSTKLDYSPESLDVLESWMLERYPDTQSIMERYEHIRWDDIGRYIGEVYAKTVGLQWGIFLDDSESDYAYFQLPVLQNPMLPLDHFCPLTMGSACLDRRTGTYLSTILKNKMR